MTEANDNKRTGRPIDSRIPEQQPQIWMQSRRGRVMDMTRPWGNVIDWKEVAYTLADINRYNGCGGIDQVSVALHLLVGLEDCPEELKPWWLLHDGHEYIMGDITTPTAMALERIAEESGRGNGGIVKRALRTLKYIHDERIHEAAGLEMPDADQKAAIRQIDMRCLNAERKTMLVREPQSWQSESFGAVDCDVRAMWDTPPYIADRLLTAFRAYLPALKQQVAA